ncbi:hypothetical protein C8J57DRAFT_1237788 [Mycena rebaudengoi]|nr:hypothetical protein C8J57DRAFT_1237788 [Mycena rebaudengoi]
MLPPFLTQTGAIRACKIETRHSHRRLAVGDDGGAKERSGASLVWSLSGGARRNVVSSERVARNKSGTEKCCSISPSIKEFQNTLQLRLLEGQAEKTVRYQTETREKIGAAVSIGPEFFMVGVHSPNGLEYLRILQAVKLRMKVSLEWGMFLYDQIFPLGIAYANIIFHKIQIWVADFPRDIRVLRWLRRLRGLACPVGSQKVIVFLDFLLDVWVWSNSSDRLQNLLANAVNLGVLAKFVTSLDRESSLDPNFRRENSLDANLRDESHRGGPRTLGQHVYTEAALRRWYSSDEVLANSPSQTKTEFDVISGADANVAHSSRTQRIRRRWTKNLSWSRSRTATPTPGVVDFDMSWRWKTDGCDELSLSNEVTKLAEAPAKDSSQPCCFCSTRDNGGAWCAIDVFGETGKSPGSHTNLIFDLVFCANRFFPFPRAPAQAFLMSLRTPHPSVRHSPYYQPVSRSSSGLFDGCGPNSPSDNSLFSLSQTVPQPSSLRDFGMDISNTLALPPPPGPPQNAGLSDTALLITKFSAHLASTTSAGSWRMSSTWYLGSLLLILMLDLQAKLSLMYLQSLHQAQQMSEMRASLEKMDLKLDEVTALKALLGNYLLRPFITYRSVVESVLAYIGSNRSKYHLEHFLTDEVIKTTIKAFLRGKVTDIKSGYPKLRKLALPLAARRNAKGADTGFWSVLEKELKTLKRNARRGPGIGELEAANVLVYSVLLVYNSGRWEQEIIAADISLHAGEAGESGQPHSRDEDQNDEQNDDSTSRMRRRSRQWRAINIRSVFGTIPGKPQTVPLGLLADRWKTADPTSFIHRQAFLWNPTGETVGSVD